MEAGFAWARISLSIIQIVLLHCPPLTYFVTLSRFGSDAHAKTLLNIIRFSRTMCSRFILQQSSSPLTRHDRSWIGNITLNRLRHKRRRICMQDILWENWGKNLSIDIEYYRRYTLARDVCVPRGRCRRIWSDWATCRGMSLVWDIYISAIFSSNITRVTKLLLSVELQRPITRMVFSIVLYPQSASIAQQSFCSHKATAQSPITFTSALLGRMHSLFLCLSVYCSPTGIDMHIQEFRSVWTQ